MYINKIVSKKTDGAGFLAEVVSVIAVTSDKLSADGNVLTVNSKYQIALTQDSYSIRATVTHNGETIISSATVAYMPYKSDVSSVVRTLGAFVAENGDFICLRFYTTYDSPKYHGIFVFGITDSNVPVFGYATATDPTVASINKVISSADASQEYTMYNSLLYTATENVLDIDNIDKKILLSGALKADSISDFLDCSTVTPNVVYPCTDGKEYYALNANTLMEV